MTLEEIRELAEKSDADDWSITDRRLKEWQFYYIRHQLDQNRIVDTEHITLTLYRKSADGTMLGSAGQEIPPTASREEVKETIRQLLARASYAENPVYELRKPADILEGRPEGSRARGDGRYPGSGEHSREERDPEETEEGFAEFSENETPAEVSASFIRAMSSLPETGTEDVNSYEIFAGAVEVRLATSTGIDVTQRYPSSMLEVVTNARRDSDPRHEIEMYRMYHSGTCDKLGLIHDISKTLRYGKDRLRTVPTPDVGTIPVLLSTADSAAVYDYFVSRMNAQMIYQKTSDWRIGEPVVRDVTGDRVSISAKRFLPNSSRNLAFDEEGALIHDEILIEGGTAKHYWGSAMYSGWLGLKDTFILSNYEVSGGSMEEEEIRTGRYLEIVEFSDFQVDSITGNIFGEIRLGYLHEPDPEKPSGETVTAVSGGSVSGSMRDYAKKMYFSQETVQYDRAKVPAVTKLMDVTVTGAK